MRVRRNRRSGLFARLRRLGILALLGGAAFWLWRELQGRHAGGSSAGPAPTGPTSGATGPDSPATTTLGAASVGGADGDGAAAPTLATADGRGPVTDGDGAASAGEPTAGDEAAAGRIKGNADSMLYHTVDSPNYKRTKAEVWFDTEEEAIAAGFQRWDHKRSGH